MPVPTATQKPGSSLPGTNVASAERCGRDDMPKPFSMKQKADSKLKRKNARYVYHKTPTGTGRLTSRRKLLWGV